MRMVREKIRATRLKDGRYTILVDYLFSNQGPTGKTELCFPTDYIFAAEKVKYPAPPVMLVGKRPVILKRKVMRNAIGYSEYSSLWIARVHFRKGQARHVRLRYSWPTNDKYRPDSLLYVLAGRNWKGKVRQSSFTLISDFTTPTAFGRPEKIGISFTTMKPRRRENRSHYQWSNWYPVGELLTGGP